MFTSTCPSCGAPISFRSAASTTAVCAFCKSTVARSADQLSLIGKQAELLQDYSPLQIGTEGVFATRAFSIIGRIQMRYAQGYWNEWYILFADGKTGWLSDSSGQYAVLQSMGQPKGLPQFDAINPGQTANLGGKVFTAIDKRNAQCVAAEGELPFAADSRWEARTIDLRSGTSSITLDFSDEATTVYQGSTVAFDALGLKRLRDLTDRYSKESTVSKVDPKSIQVLACKSCATPIKLVLSQTARIVCPSCSSELSTQQGSLVVEVERAEKNLQQTKLMPGDSGEYYGFQWTVLGVLKKFAVEDPSSQWEEYLLYCESQGFRWLSNSDGAWQWIKVLDEQPEISGGSATAEGQRFNLVERYKGQTSYVAGAFNWQAKAGEVVTIQEFRAGEKVLSSEQNESEQTWSIGNAVDGHAILVAFGKLKNKKNLAADTKSAQDSNGQHWLLTPTIISTGVLLMIIMPAWFMSSLDAPIEETIFALLALWAPLWFVSKSNAGDET